MHPVDRGQQIQFAVGLARRLIGHFAAGFGLATAGGKLKRIALDRASTGVGTVRRSCRACRSGTEIDWRYLRPDDTPVEPTVHQWFELLWEISNTDAGQLSEYQSLDIPGEESIDAKSIRWEVIPLPNPSRSTAGRDR